VRCPRCGNDNPDGMRFCGMCGGTLLSSAPPARPQPERGAAPSGEVSAPATATATRPPAPHEPRVTESSPSISGPSFLGLNDAPPASRKRANLSIDHHGSGSRNLDYLLDDEEHHRGGGAGKFFLIVLALALAVGFGYLRWKGQLPWLNAGAGKPAAATQTPDQPATDSATSSSPGTTPESQPAASTTGNQPPANQPAASQPANSAAATPPASNQAQPAADAGSGPPTGTTASEDGAASKNPPADSAPASKAAEPAAKADDSSDNSEPAAAEEPAPRPKPAPPPKPRAASKPVDSVAEARRYLYGRGAAQDCERGLRLLKPAANQGDPKAMIEMGALYSAGLCTPHDLPTAYRWFAIALRKDPSNQAIQTDLQKLWGEMTQPERQLAIKLTQ